MATITDGDLNGDQTVYARGIESTPYSSRSKPDTVSDNIHVRISPSDEEKEKAVQLAHSAVWLDVAVFEVLKEFVQGKFLPRTVSASDVRCVDAKTGSLFVREGVSWPDLVIIDGSVYVRIPKNPGEYGLVLVFGDITYTQQNETAPSKKEIVIPEQFAQLYRDIFVIKGVHPARLLAAKRSVLSKLQQFAKQNRIGVSINDIDTKFDNEVLEYFRLHCVIHAEGVEENLKTLARGMNNGIIILEKFSQDLREVRNEIDLSFNETDPNEVLKGIVRAFVVKASHQFKGDKRKAFIDFINNETTSQIMELENQIEIGTTCGYCQTARTEGENSCQKCGGSYSGEFLSKEVVEKLRKQIAELHEQKI